MPRKISRSKIDLFIDCPRCFYLEQVLGISRPRSAPFTLNVAVDHLLKKEFDIHRKDKTPHPLMEKHGVEAIPFEHENMDKWRHNFTGIQHVCEKEDLLIFGAVDDIWINKKGELIVVDYKATAKEGEIELEDTKWHNQYRRQMEIYQWLLRQNDFKVSDTGYFVYVNGKKDREGFNGKLEFDVKLIPYTGSDEWVGKTLKDIRKCLDSKKVPDPSSDCEWCQYRKGAIEAFREHHDKEV